MTRRISLALNEKLTFCSIHDHVEVEIVNGAENVRIMENFVH